MSGIAISQMIFEATLFGTDIIAKSSVKSPMFLYSCLQTLLQWIFLPAEILQQSLVSPHQPIVIQSLGKN